MPILSMIVCPQGERLAKLNKIAIQQMKLLTDDRGIKKLKDKGTANEREWNKESPLEKGVVDSPEKKQPPESPFFKGDLNVTI